MAKFEIDLKTPQTVECAGCKIQAPMQIDSVERVPIYDSMGFHTRVYEWQARNYQYPDGWNRIPGAEGLICGDCTKKVQFLISHGIPEKP